MTKLLRVMGLVVLSTGVSATSAHANVVAEWNAVAVQCIAVGDRHASAELPGPAGPPRPGDRPRRHARRDTGDRA